MALISNSSKAERLLLNQIPISLSGNIASPDSADSKLTTFPVLPPLLQWVHPTCHQWQPVPLPLLFETNFPPIAGSLCLVLYPCSPCPVQFSCSVVFNSLRPHGQQHSRPPCPSPTAGVYPNSCPLSRWCHPTISSSVIPFSSCPQTFPASGSFPMSQLFVSGGQSTGVSASVSTPVLPMNTQDWSPLEWTGWISLQSPCPLMYNMPS